MDRIFNVICLSIRQFNTAGKSWFPLHILSILKSVLLEYGFLKNICFLGEKTKPNPENCLQENCSYSCLGSHFKFLFKLYISALHVKLWLGADVFCLHLLLVTVANIDMNKIFRHKWSSVGWRIEMFQIDNYKESFKLQGPPLSVFRRDNHHYYKEI